MRRLGPIAATLSLVALALVCAALWNASEMALRPGWYVHRTPEQGLQPAETFKGWQGAIHDPGQDFGYASTSLIQYTTLQKLPGCD